MAESKPTAYDAGKALMIGGIVSGIFIVWGIPLLAVAAGLAQSGWLDWIVMPLLVVWVVLFGIRSLLIRCPNCGKSIFRRGIWSVFWPEKTCSRCGTDLTAVSPKGRDA
ncbi:hypothetical protein [Croceicoccus sediminis]|uniref:hypothetical protein n=1 Tax=Croceicoccus sediminis TaxID=2571150 RepID=UPI0011823102|nr:hypothetical protein [Croceicoccus sediminis]